MLSRLKWMERDKKTHTYCSWNTRCQHIVHILCITCTGFPYPWMRGWTCMYCTVYKCTCGVLLWIFVFSIRTINMIKAIVSLGFMRKYRFSSKTKQKKHFANFILQFSSNSKKHSLQFLELATSTWTLGANCMHACDQHF